MPTTPMLTRRWNDEKSWTLEAYERLTGLAWS